MPYGGSRFNSSKVQRKINQTGGDFHVREFSKPKLDGISSYFGSGIPSGRQILRVRRSAISVCLGTVVTRRGSAEIDVLAMFCPFVGENTSEPFQVSDELPSFHLHLELFDHDFVFG